MGGGEGNGGGERKEVKEGVGSKEKGGVEWRGGE